MQPLAVASSFDNGQRHGHLRNRGLFSFECQRFRNQLAQIVELVFGYDASLNNLQGVNWLLAVPNRQEQSKELLHTLTDEASVRKATQPWPPGTGGSAPAPRPAQLGRLPANITPPKSPPCTPRAAKL